MRVNQVDACFHKVARAVCFHCVNMDETQAEIRTWTSKNFGDEDPIGIIVLGLVEEIGELARCYVKQEQGIRGTTAQWEMEMKKEIGDILIKLHDVADRSGFLLSDCFYERWDDVKQRDFTVDKNMHGMPESDSNG